MIKTPSDDLIIIKEPDQKLERAQTQLYLYKRALSMRAYILSLGKSYEEFSNLPNDNARSIARDTA